MKNTFQDLEEEYPNEILDELSLPSSPFQLFESWINEAIRAKIKEPNGMTFSTVSLEGRPSARTVLLKKIDQNGFIFFTHYESRKAIQLNACPFAALTFWWKEINRQICIEGKVEKIPYQDSDHYFQTRQRGSQIATWASPQSCFISRQELEKKFLEYQLEFENKKIHCPTFWGGYKVIPERFEFWQGVRYRLSDRFIYLKEDKEPFWQKHRLAP